MEGIMSTRIRRESRPPWSLLLAAALAAWLPAMVVEASGPLFIEHVISSTTSPAFILLDTDGEDWALEADEAVANAFSIGHDLAPSTYAFVMPHAIARL